MEVRGCLRCGRRLTVKKSLKRGYGPKCWEILRGLYLQNDGSFEKALGGPPRLMWRVVALLEEGR